MKTTYTFYMSKTSQRLYTSPLGQDVFSMGLWRVPFTGFSQCMILHATATVMHVSRSKLICQRATSSVSSSDTSGLSMWLGAWNSTVLNPALTLVHCATLDKSQSLCDSISTSVKCLTTVVGALIKGFAAL